mgnify:CR=1 FL=1
MFEVAVLTMAASRIRRNKERTFLIGMIITFCLVILIFRLFWLQTVASNELNTEAQKNWIVNKVLTPKRGSIYERTKKQKLAWEVDAYVFGAELEQVKDPKKTAEVLASILKVPKQQIEHKLTSERKKGRKSIELRFPGKYKYPESVFQQVKKRKEQDDALDGIYAFPTKKRAYIGKLAAHVVGFLNSEDYPVGGVEAYYDRLLRGKSGNKVYKKTKDGIMVDDEPQKFSPPVDGKDLVLTIDLKIQKQVEKELEQAMKLYKAKGGTAIVADPKTGEILALVNRPTFDPNDPAKTYDSKKNGHNLAVESQFEPGSTFKIITLAAAIEEGKFQPDAVFQSGKIQVEDQIIRDWNVNGWGKITYREGVELSSNVAFVRLGQMLGQKKLVSYINRFGFGDVTKRFGKKTGIDLPAEGRGYYFKGTLYPTELAAVSFGQGISVTPIQQVAAVCAIANGGILYKPHVLKEIWNPETKKREKVIKPQGKRIISSSTTKKVRDLLRDVVKKGTGSNADLPGYHVAGKTGTAQKPNPNGPGYLKDKYVVSFIGFAPTENPEVVVYIALDEPSSSTGDVTGGTVAAPLAKEVMKKTLQIREVNKRDQRDSQLLK